MIYLSLGTVSTLAMHRLRGQSAGPLDTGLSACHQDDVEELDRTRIAKRTYANTESGFGIDDKVPNPGTHIRNPGQDLNTKTVSTRKYQG